MIYFIWILCVLFYSKLFTITTAGALTSKKKSFEATLRTLLGKPYMKPKIDRSILRSHPHSTAAAASCRRTCQCPRPAFFVVPSCFRGSAGRVGTEELDRTPPRCRHATNGGRARVRAKHALPLPCRLARSDNVQRSPPCYACVVEWIGVE